VGGIVSFVVAVVVVAVVVVAAIGVDEPLDGSVDTTLLEGSAAVFSVDPHPETIPPDTAITAPKTTKRRFIPPTVLA
jgi:hypothetical protein